MFTLLTSPTKIRLTGMVSHRNQNGSLNRVVHMGGSVHSHRIGVRSLSRRTALASVSFARSRAGVQTGFAFVSLSRVAEVRPHVCHNGLARAQVGFVARQKTIVVEPRQEDVTYRRLPQKKGGCAIRSVSTQADTNGIQCKLGRDVGTMNAFFTLWM